MGVQTLEVQKTNNQTMCEKKFKKENYILLSKTNKKTLDTVTITYKPLQCKKMK